MTDAIAEELLGPAEDEEGEEIEEEDDSVRGDGHVVAGGATLNASRRGKVKDEKPKMKPKKKKTPRELEEEDDPLGGFLELLGLEDEEEEEYVAEIQEGQVEILLHVLRGERFEENVIINTY